MASTAHFARRFRYLTLLRWSLGVGAAYDLLFALAMVAAPDGTARLLDLPLPGETFYLWILAVLLAMLAGLYTLAARDPRRYSGIIAMAIAGRVVGGLALLAAALPRPDLAGLYPLAAMDLAFGASHALFWWPIRS